MSYIQIELGGKQRGLKFNNRALEIFTKYTDYQTTQGDLYSAIYAGLTGNAYVKREEFVYSFEEVCDWCDEAKQDDIVSAYNVFCETSAFKKWYEAFKELLRTRIEETEKKSQTMT